MAHGVLLYTFTITLQCDYDYDTHTCNFSRYEKGENTVHGSKI
jgi:hypothetical protein